MNGKLISVITHVFVWWFFYCSRRWLCLPRILILASPPGTSSPRAMVSIVWGGLLAHRQHWHVGDFAHHREAWVSQLSEPSPPGRAISSLGLGKQYWSCTQEGQGHELLQTDGRVFLFSLPGVQQLWMLLQWRASSKFSPSFWQVGARCVPACLLLCPWQLSSAPRQAAV